MTLAEKKLGLVTEERPIELRKEIVNFSEAAACGTAAVLSPIGSIWFDGDWHDVGNPEHVGPVMQQLYDLLVGIQKGEADDEFGWTVDVA
jgi:branched-chain amino acid aminotransferase